MPKRKTTFNEEWSRELEFIKKSRIDIYHDFVVYSCETNSCETIYPWVKQVTHGGE